MEKLQALEVELERKHGCRVLIIQVTTIVVIARFVVIVIVIVSIIIIVSISILVNTITITIINTITKCVQVDFTDISVLPVIVQRLKEEKIEVKNSTSPIILRNLIIPALSFSAISSSSI